MKNLIVMPFALFAATALLPACSKSIPAKRYHTVANLEHNSDFTVEIEGQSATGKSYVLVNGIVKDGTPVKVTYQTVCGERSVTFPFVRDTGSIAPRDVQRRCPCPLVMVGVSSVYPRWRRPACQRTVISQCDPSSAINSCTDILRAEQLAYHFCDRAGKTSQSSHGLEKKLRAAFP